ncbi:MAG: hypothetical protein AAGD10_05290 [Myxococcota bacterium]
MNGRGRASSLDAPWLYQRGDQVFGPVPAKELLRMLYAGELGFATLVAPDGKEFRPVERYEMFLAHKEKVEAARREVVERERRQKAEASLRLRRRLGWAMAALVIAVLGAWGVQLGRTAWAESRAERLREDAERKLQQELEALMASVTIEPPLQALPIETPAPESKKRRSRGGRRKRGARPALPSGGAPSEAAIMARMGSLFPQFKRCIARQIQRAPDSVGNEIRLRFTIANDGRVKDFSLADRFLRRAPLQPCLSSVMSSVRWPAFEGEIRNVFYPIRVGRS